MPSLLQISYFKLNLTFIVILDISGPLVFKTSKKVHILVGVVSFGPQGCGDPTLPNVFARVTEVLGWIFSVMKPSAKTCLPTETDLKARLYYL